LFSLTFEVKIEKCRRRINEIHFEKFELQRADFIFPEISFPFITGQIEINRIYFSKDGFSFFSFDVSTFCHHDVKLKSGKREVNASGEGKYAKAIQEKENCSLRKVSRLVSLMKIFNLSV
jgi:hypothetical protein